MTPSWTSKTVPEASRKTRKPAAETENYPLQPHRTGKYRIKSTFFRSLLDAASTFLDMLTPLCPLRNSQRHSFGDVSRAFALFYLRSVAPDSKHVDKVNGKLADGVTTALS